MANTRVKEPISNMGILASVSIFIALVCDGMDLQMLALTLPLLMHDLHLDNVMGGLLGTWTLIGMLLGGIMSGWLADSWGRVRVTIAGVAVFTVGTLALAFTHSFWQFAIIRCLSGFGLSAVYSIGTMLAAEYIPTSRRTTVLGILQAGWSVGYIVAAVLSAYILPSYGWRPLFVISIIPGVLSLVLMRYLKEPPSWYAARQDGPAKNSRSEWGSLLANKTTLKYFLLWTITSFFLQAGYYGANTWLPSYLVKDLGVNLKSMGWYVAATYSMMVMGKILTGALADHFGRRKMWITVGLLTAASMPLIMHYATPANIPYLLLAFGFLYGAPYALTATYMSESFATSIRGTAVAGSYNIGRLGSIISPLAIGVLSTQYSISYGIALLGVAYFICAVIPGLFIREKMYDPKAVAISAAPVKNLVGSHEPA